MLEAYIAKLAKELKLEERLTNQNKIFELTINPEVHLIFSDKENVLYLWAKITQCPKESLEDLFIMLMKSNFLGQGTGESLIGLTADEKYLTLSTLMPYELSYQEFKNRTEDFVNYLTYWKKEIHTFEKKIRQNLY